MDYNKEMKKLNFALASYPCGYTADYEVNKKEGSVTFFLFDAGELEIMAHKCAEPVRPKELNAFKHSAIRKCSHAS